MAHVADTQTLLGREITKRLTQLRISRREFVRRTGLSRQTLHNVEREGITDLWATTFRALDRGLGWPSGTAEALAKNDESVLDALSSDESNAMVLRESLLARVADMTPQELDVLTKVLETGLFGRAASTMGEHVALMDKALHALNEAGRDVSGKVVG